MRHALLVVALFCAGCASPTAPSAIATLPPPSAIPPSTQAPTVVSSLPADGAYRGVMADLIGELTIDRARGHRFRVLTNTNRVCVEAGGANQPLVFSAQVGTLGCYVRDAPSGNASEYLRVCLMAPDRAEGAFWLHPGTHFDAPQCINGPQPPPASARQLPTTGGGAFGFVLTRQ